MQFLILFNNVVKEVVKDLFGSSYAGYGIPGVDDDILADIIGDPLMSGIQR